MYPVSRNFTYTKRALKLPDSNQQSVEITKCTRRRPRPVRTHLGLLELAVAAVAQVGEDVRQLVQQQQRGGRGVAARRARGHVGLAARQRRGDVAVRALLVQLHHVRRAPRHERLVAHDLLAPAHAHAPHTSLL